MPDPERQAVAPPSWDGLPLSPAHLTQAPLIQEEPWLLLLAYFAP